MPSGSEESRLVRAAASGDGSAFASLYETYERPIFNYVLRLLGDRHEAEDATQDAFIRVMAKLPELDLDRFEFAPYLYTAARNAGYD
nr:sigma factor [Solirubrobacterales bacterium]